MSQSDKSFDTKALTFAKNIYGTGKGKLREAILTRDLEHYIFSSKKLKVLDIGGGQGQIALKFAKQGHDVTITDISEEMLNLGRETAKSLGVEAAFIHCPLQELSTHLDQKFDLVLCHAVFEWLAEPSQAMGVLKAFCQAQGVVSLMFYNRSGQELSNLIYGNFDYIKAGLKAKKVVKLNPQSSLDQDDVLLWAQENNLSLITKSGVRCFHDYMRDISMWENKFDEILEMELKYSQMEPFASIGRYTHFILQN